jgi:hypothetical protein
MANEVNEEACYLDMPNGLSKEINYPQKFVRAPKQGKYPCNEAAKKVPVSAEAMRISLGK